jgi:hypothetical protein
LSIRLSLDTGGEGDDAVDGVFVYGYDTREFYRTRGTPFPSALVNIALCFFLVSTVRRRPGKEHSASSMHGASRRIVGRSVAELLGFLASHTRAKAPVRSWSRTAPDGHPMPHKWRERVRFSVTARRILTGRQGTRLYDSILVSLVPTKCAWFRLEPL